MQNPVTTTSSDERNWAMFCHLGALTGVIIPLGNLLVPLVLWLMKKQEMPLVDEQGKESLNFQITIMIGFAISIVLMFVLVGFLLIFILGILDIIFIIIAAIKVSEGVNYKYPMALRLIK